MSALVIGTARLLRTTNIILGSSTWTYAFWFRLNSDAGPSTYQSLFTLEDSSPAFEKFIQVFTEDTGSGPAIGVALSNNVSSASINGPVINVGQWYYCALVKSGNTHNLYLNGVSQGTTSLSFNAVTFDSLYLGYDTFSTEDLNFSSYREWNGVLSAAQIIAEAKWSIPALATNLKANTPLVDNPDDTTVNNNDWTEDGSITYEADSPYPSVNVDPTNAIDIGDLSSDYQQIVNANPSGAFAFDLWWKFTNPSAALKVLSIFGRSGNYAVNRTDVDFFETPGATTGASISSDDNYPIIGYMRSAATYYISATPSSRTANPYVVTMDIAAAPNESIPQGAIFSNDDQQNLPAVLLSSTIDYEVYQYVDIPAGEMGDIILNGNFLIGDRYTPNMKLYDRDFTLLASFTGAHGGNQSRAMRANRATSKFYFIRNANLMADAIVDVISGTAIETTFTMTGTVAIQYGSITPKLDDTILYHCINTTNSPIKAWDIVNGIDLGNVVAGIASEGVVDMLSLADGTYAVLRLAGDDAKVYHYDNSWVLINTWNLGPSTANSVPPRMTWGLDDPNSVWVKRFITDEGDPIISRGVNLRLSDGSILSSVDHATFFDGAYTPELFDGSAPIALMGWPSSCPFFLFPVGVGAGTLTIGKMTEPNDPDTEFVIDVGGGLTPAQLTLLSDEEHVYDPVPVGIYSVVEQADTQHFAIYLVSNDPNNDNLNVSVGDGENVTVVVLNQLRARFSGIYKIVPGKPTDTYINQNGEPTVLGIPDPFFITGGIKDH